MNYENSLNNVNYAYEQMKGFRFEYQCKEMFANVISIILLYCGYSAYQGFQNNQHDQGWMMVCACIFLTLFFLVWYIFVAISEKFYNNANQHYKSLLEAHEKAYGKVVQK